MDLVFAAGMVTLAYFSYHLIKFIYMLVNCYLLPRLGFETDLRSYGEWAVITGATDGIGKQYAVQLAQRGFPIVLISRTESKLQSVAKEIRDAYDVETKCVVYDFTDTENYDVIKKELDGLDIGILVNNVGVSYAQGQKFCDSDIDKNVNTMIVNFNSALHMTHIVLPGMVERKRGAIVHISSGSVYFDLSHTSPYIISKVAMNKFVISLQLSYPFIENQLVIPFFVSTNLSKKQPSLLIPTSEAYVRQAIGTLGRASQTHGCLNHELQKPLLANVGAPLLRLYYSFKQ